MDQPVSGELKQTSHGKGDNHDGRDLPSGAEESGVSVNEVKESV